MYKFSRRSKEKRDTCHEDIIEILDEAIQYMDFTVVCGHRNEEDQNLAYDEGFSKLRFPNSRHNKLPSIAVDIVPYFKEKPHLRWEDEESFHQLNELISKIARLKGIDLDWGFDLWGWDMPHYQLRGK